MTGPIFAIFIFFVLGWPILLSGLELIYIVVTGRLCKKCGHKYKKIILNCPLCGEFNNVPSIFDGDD